MTDRPKILLHVGYPKTASTWLQRNLFTNPSVGFSSPIHRRIIVDKLITPHPLEYDAESTARYFESTLQKSLKSRLTTVISREGFAGRLFTSQFEVPIYADRLKSLFPNASILIVIREQRSMLLSRYAEYVFNQYGVWSLDQFLDATIRPLETWHGPWQRLSHLKYDRFVRHYQTLFGQNKVLVLPFELFKVNPEKFVRKITFFYNIPTNNSAISDLPYSNPVNHSISWYWLPVIRRLNWLFGQRTPRNPLVFFPNRYIHTGIKRTISSLDRHLPKRLRASSTQSMKKMIYDTVSDFYSESNRRTMDITGLNLTKYGYAIGH